MDIEFITPPKANKNDAIDAGLVALTEAISKIDEELVAHGALGGEFGYGADFENDVFVMRSYYWGDCDCGADERSEKWHAENPHAPDCFREELHRRFDAYDQASGYLAAEQALKAEGNMVEEVVRDGPWVTTIRNRTAAGEAAHKAWCAAHDIRNKEHARLTEELYIERGLKPDAYQWLCTCGVDERAKEYFATESHYATCAIELPNFMHKRTGAEVRWYKWIGRSMEVKAPDGIDWQVVFAECMGSLHPKN